MKRVVYMPVLAAVLASVRFFNEGCTQVDAGQASFGFGIPNTSGTDIGNGTGTIVGSKIEVGAPSPFEFVGAGSSQYSVLNLPGNVTAVEGSEGVVNLTAGGVYTFAILPKLGSWRLANIPR